MTTPETLPAPAPSAPSDAPGATPARAPSPALTAPADAARTRFDLVVVGAGTAGLVGATTAASLGARVALVDRTDPGGDCLWTGCVPSKTLLASAQRAADARDAERFGVRAAGVEVDFPAVMARVRAVIATIEPDDDPATLAAAGVTVVRGTARFTSLSEHGGVLDVDGAALRFDRALVTTGASPTVPDLPGLAAAEPMTSETLWDLDELPPRLVVLGGGPVGVETSQAFARLGSQVVLVHGGERVLEGDDPDASAVVHDALVADGVDVRLGERARAVRGRSGEDVHLDLDDGSTVDATHLLVALGRTPSTAGLGLDRVAVALDEGGAVVVDAARRTTSARVWAAGDVTGPPYYTHTAGLDASTAAANAVLGLRSAASTVVPHVTFTDPEVGSVGLPTWGEMDGHSVRTVQHAHVDRAVTAGQTAGFSRLRLDRRGRVVGATVVSPRAGETLGEMTVALARKVTATQVGSVQHAYPTFSDGAWDAAIADRRARIATPVARAGLRALLRVRRWRDRR